jgi:hypothetical protein
MRVRVSSKLQSRDRKGVGPWHPFFSLLLGGSQIPEAFPQAVEAVAGGVFLIHKV